MMYQRGSGLWTMACAVAVVAMSFVSSGCGGPAGGAETISTAAALQLALSQIQATLDGLQIGGNEVLTDRIDQASDEARRLIDRLEKLRANGFKDANEVVNDVARSTHTLSADLRGLVKESEHRMFLDLNSSLANLNNTLDGLPLVDIEPYLAAVEPMRVSQTPFDKRVTLHGYFPLLDDPDSSVEISILGVSIRPTEGVGGTLHFELPERSLEKETFVPFDVKLTTERGWKFWKPRRERVLSDRLYVENPTPYACTFSTLVENPELQVEVVANREYTARAATEGGEHRPSVNESRSATELFTATVDDAVALYDVSSVRIKEPRARTWGNSPCEHSRWSAQLDTWDESGVSYSLSAPSKEPHMHSGTRCEDTFLGEICGIPYAYLHGGGGSHANIGLRPVFVAKRAGLPALVEQGVASFELPRSGATEIPVAVGEAWRIHLQCSFRDGSEAWDTGLIALDAQDPEEAAQGLSARFSEGRLFVHAL